MTIEYLKLVSKVLNIGTLTKNRTGTDTLTVFGHQMRFNLRNNELPIITTKYVNFEMVAKELFWFMSGATNQRLLEEQNVKIWKANSTREFLNSRGLYNYKEYETLGPIYGFQWRHFGAKYIDSDTDYTGQGVDQLKNVCDTIKNDPTSRRIIMSAWNPADIDKMALPPCHSFVQFHVDNNELSSHMYQRSADIMLGVPYNITSYALLTHIIAKICNLKCGEFVHTIGNAHIYLNHETNARIQVEREPYHPPQLEINFGDDEIDFDKCIKSLNLSQFQLKNYKHHETIRYDMVV